MAKGKAERVERTEELSGTIRIPSSRIPSSRIPSAEGAPSSEPSSVFGSGFSSELNNELNNVGLKATLPRLKVLELFHAHERRHLSAEDVYRRLSEGQGEVGLATVYRILNQLTEVGILVRSLFDGESGKAVYEVHQGKHHDHLICLECGRVDEFVDDVIEMRQRAVAESNGYALAQRQLALYGYCASCRGGKKPRD